MLNKTSTSYLLNTTHPTFYESHRPRHQEGRFPQLNQAKYITGRADILSDEALDRTCEHINRRPDNLEDGESSKRAEVDSVEAGLVWNTKRENYKRNQIRIKLFI